MPKQIPAEAGFFRVELRVPAPNETAKDFHRDFDAWIGAMAMSQYAEGLGALPSIRIEQTTEDYAEIVLEWDHAPADDLWNAVETQINKVAKLAFPDLLKLPDELVVTVTRVRGVGHDVTLDDKTLESLSLEADDQIRWPPSDA